MILITLHEIHASGVSLQFEVCWNSNFAYLQSDDLNDMHADGAMHYQENGRASILPGAEQDYGNLLDVLSALADGNFEGLVFQSAGARVCKENEKLVIELADKRFHPAGIALTQDFPNGLEKIRSDILRDALEMKSAPDFLKTCMAD